MTGAGAPGAAGIIYCLKSDPRVGLTVADASENAVGKYLVNDFVLVPKASDPAFIPSLMKICQEKRIDIVLPLVTRELLPLSQHIDKFKEKGIKVLVSFHASIEIANNKSTCYQFLKSKGVALPEFFVVNNVEQFIHAAFELGHPQKSFCFKPSVSNGSRGVRIVSDSLDESHQLFYEKPYNLNITYAHALHILSSHPFPELLVSEYLPGPEYSVDCLAENGEVHLAVPRLRKKMVNGISVEGEFINDPTIINYCKSIIEAIGLHGNIGIQVKMSEGDEPLLLEINPRVQGTIVAALGAGVNLPLLAIKQELDLPTEPEEWEVKWGTKFSRYWSEVYY